MKMCFVLLNGKKLLVPLLLRHTNVTNATNALSTVAFFCFFVFLIIVFVNLFTYRLKLFYQDFQLFYCKIRLHCQMDQTAVSLVRKINCDYT